MSDSVGCPWQRLRLQDVASKIQDGTHFSPASTSGPFRYLTSRNVRFGYIDLAGSGWLSETEHRSIYRRCDPRLGDLLLTKDGANTGNAAINPLNEEFSLLSSVAMLRFDPLAHVANFYLQYLLSPRGQSRLKYQVSGNAITRLTLTKIKNFFVPVPPRAEQHRIAEILDAADEEIRSTERLIAKLEQSNQGILHDLLARGVDENGKIRDPKAHPEKFTDSKIGLMPSGWSIGPLGSYIALQRGFDITVPEQRPGNVPVVSSSGISSFHDKPMVKGPGVVIGRKGKLGDAYYIVPDFWPHDTSLWVKRFNNVMPEFAAVLLRSMRLERFDAATSVPTLNRNFIHPILIGVPPISEQAQILSCLDAASRRTRHEECYLAKLRALKQGLMDDLLTGRRGWVP